METDRQRLRAREREESETEKDIERPVGCGGWSRDHSQQETGIYLLEK